MFVFVLLLLPLITTARSSCEYNCPCSDDSICAFYCDNGRCQYSIPIYQNCSGYPIHPRECGPHRWCNRLTKRCEYGTADYFGCQYNYECLSGSCGEKGWCVPNKVHASTVVPSVIAGVLFLTLIIVIIIYQKRIAALKKHSIHATIINPAASINTEVKPPPYRSVSGYQ
jgi:hypothetical protein